MCHRVLPRKNLAFRGAVTHDTYFWKPLEAKKQNKKIKYKIGNWVEGWLKYVSYVTAYHETLLSQRF